MLSDMRWSAEWPDLTVRSPKACATLIWERFCGVQDPPMGRVNNWNYWRFWQKIARN
jgi:hypothetical protein